MRDEMKKVPRLRFRGFQEDWELCKLGDVADHFEYGLNASAIEYDGKNKYLRITDIDDSSRKFIQNKLTSPNINVEEASNYILTVGDILFARTGASVGKTYRYDIKDGKVYFAGFLIRARIKDSFDSEFVYWTTLTDRYNTFIKIMSQRSGQPGINAKEYSSFNILIPNIKEQQKIGAFLKKIDDTIALHQRKLEQLKELKKAYLQVIFPVKDERVPKLRFAAFEEGWELRKLGDITKISTGKLDANAMVENGKYDFYTSGIKKYRIDVPAFEGPAITIAGNGATVGYMHLADNKFNAYQRTYVLQEFVVDRSFLFSEIGNKLPKKINQEARTGNIPYIVMDMLTELKLSIPQDEAEQSKIGSFFKQIDKTITLHQNKLEQLKDLKTSYLQNMFI
ncbi:restriction endonuclease subunit S [Enterococcus faecalis]|uniref:restriction endonuclease subunit S n=1 Tax=Enterococcus faecalis TaxID=1351 RepID=UPI00115CA771